MDIKKFEIYSAILERCNNLRGGMDDSLYKDYVLFMLFIKYVSDKFVNAGACRVFKVPEGSSFDDMRQVKGRPDIGDQINKKIIQLLVDANSSTLARTDFPDFNDATKHGSGKQMVTGSRRSSRFLKTRTSIFPVTVPTTTTSSGMPMSSSCGTSPRKAARARGQFYYFSSSSQATFALSHSAKVAFIGINPP